MDGKRLVVGINSVALLSPLTGIGHYVKNLLHRFQESPELEVRSFYGSHWSDQLRTEPLPESITRLKATVRRWLPAAYELSRAIQQRRFSSGIRNIKADVYHEPNFLAYRYDGATVVTVHDLSWIRYPETHPKERVRAMDKYFEPGLRRATRILTDSHFVKQELVGSFGIAPHMVEPVHLGADLDFQPMSPQQTQLGLGAHGLKHSQYILAVGTIEPRKNLKAAIDAFMRLPQTLRRNNPLILVGLKGWLPEPLWSRITPLIASGEIRHMGYLSRGELVTVTAGARALLYPSIYEGFGLPPLEAMSCGVPVITSNVSSLPEVVGTGGILVAPDNIEGMTEALERLIVDPAFHAQMKESALLQSRNFSWAKCSEQTLNIYRQAAAA